MKRYLELNQFLQVQLFVDIGFPGIIVFLQNLSLNYCFIHLSAKTKLNKISLFKILILYISGFKMQQFCFLLVWIENISG